MFTDPTSLFTKSMESFEKMTQESTARMQAWLGELEKVRAAGTDQLQATLTHYAALQKDTLAYALDLGRAWMTLAQDAWRQAVQTASPAATKAQA